MKKPTTRTLITDSPWFWALLFPAFGLIMLLITGGKFGKRQAGIENRYQARAAVASGQVVVDQAGSGKKQVTGAPKYTTADDVAIPIWPLEVAMAAIAGTSGVMLWRNRARYTVNPPAATPS